MSQFEQGARIDPTRRNYGAPAPRAGITESVVPVGLEALPPVSTESDLTVQLMQSLDMGAQAATLTGEYLGRQRALQDAEDAQLEQLHRGHAARQAETDAPQILDDAKQGKLVPPDGMTVEQFATEYLNGRTTDQPIQFRDEYLQRLRPALQRALLAKEDEVREQAKADATQNLADQATGQATVEGITAAMQAGMNTLGLTPEQAKKDIAYPALVAAAQLGDVKGWDAAVAALDGSLLTEQARQRGVFEEAVRVRESRARGVAEDEVAASYLALRKPGSTATYDDVRKAITDRRDIFGNDRTETLLREADSREANGLRLAAEQAKAVEFQRATDAAISAETDNILNARTTGGIVPDDVTIQFPDGSSKQIKGEATRDAAVQVAMQRIAAQSPTPEVAIASQIEMLSLIDEKFKPWQNVLSAGWSGASVAFETAKPGDEAKVQVPTNTTQGFELFKRLTAVSPSYRNRLMPDEQTGLFYERAALAEQYVTGGDINKALALAAKASTSEQSVGIRDDELGVADWAAGTSNEGEIRAKVRMLAQLYIKGMGTPKDAAIAAANAKVQDVHTLIGGALIYTGNTNLVPDFPAISRQFASAYAAKYGESEGVAADRLALLPGPLPGVYLLNRTDGAVPVLVDRFDEAGVGSFSEADLRRQSVANQDAERRRIVELANKIPSNPNDPVEATGMLYYNRLRQQRMERKP